MDSSVEHKPAAPASKRTWSLSDIPDLGDRTAVITGGNVGLGFRCALELARKGARVVIAFRSPDKGEAAAARIGSEVSGARVDVARLDLVNLDSVRQCAEQIAAGTERLDILLNNAGVVNLKTLQRTATGHEMHMAVNHFGHFALTGGLFALLARTPGARIVTVTSLAWKSGTIDFDDLDWRRRPYSLKAYGDSKLANLLFMRALQGHLEAAGASALSLAAHPGLTATERQQSIGVGGVLARLIASPVEQGVRPQLRAATDPAADKREVYGPRFGIRGRAVPTSVSGKAVDDALADRLWEVSEELTRVRYPA